MTQPLWQMTIPLPTIAVEVFLEAFDDPHSATSCFEDGEDWKLVSYYQSKPDQQAITEKMNHLAKLLNIPTPTFIIEPVEPQDWVAESQKKSQPCETSDFFVHPSWYDGDIPDKKHIIRIDPKQAFGTGGHATTFGCLEAISATYQTHTHANHLLDLGCGSGLLAIAMAKLWIDSTIVAVDNDPLSVDATKENIHLNHTASIQCFESQGFGHEYFRLSPPFDVIVANILAQPLIDLAPLIKQHLTDKGVVILSGLLIKQKQDVLDAYKAIGFDEVSLSDIGDWSILILTL